VAISTSGNSTNILSAIAAAISRLQTIALLGSRRRARQGLAQHELIVPISITARIQEAHKFLLHVLCEIVEARWLQPESRLKNRDGCVEPFFGLGPAREGRLAPLPGSAHASVPGSFAARRELRASGLTRARWVL